MFMFMATGLSAFFDMQVYKTEQFTLLFPPGYEERAVLLLSEIETFKTVPERIVGNKLYNVPIVLEDAGQYTQGYADPVYYKMAVFNYENTDARWLRMGAVHEYTHMLSMLKKSGAPSVLTAVFGDILSPGIFAPDWMLEGITTYDESQLSPFSGRLNNFDFEPFIETLVSEGKSPDLMKATYAPFEPPYENFPYLFGGEFFGYLAKTYGEEKFSKFFESYGASLLSYFTYVLPAIAMDNTFREVYGKSTEELWNDWSGQVKEKYKNYKMEGDKITNRGFYTGSPVIHEGKLYYINNKSVKTGVFDTWSFHNIVERDLKTGVEKDIVSAVSSINKGLKFSGKKLYYSVNQVDFPYPNRFESGFGYDSVLCEKDMVTGAGKELFEGSISAFCPDSPGLIIYSSNEIYKYGSKIMRYNLAAKTKEELFEIPYTVTEITPGSSENVFIISARLESENSGIFELNRKDKTIIKIIDTPWAQDSPIVYGSRIFYSSNADNAKRLYYYDMKDKLTYTLTENGTAYETAFDEENNDIYFVGLNLHGSDIYKKKFVPQKIAPKKYAGPDSKPLVKAVFIRGSYLDNLATLYPKIRYPYFDYRDNDTYGAGVELMGQDAAGDFSYDTAVFYDSAFKKACTNITVGFSFLNPLILAVNYQSLESYFGAGMQGPVYTNLTGGISDIIPSLVYGYKGSTGQKGIMPSINTDFKFITTNGSIYLGSFFEQPWLGSNRRSETYKAELNINQYLGASIMKIKAGFIKSTYKNSGWIGDVRGYAEKAEGKKGVYASAEIFKPLFELHGGLWNPNIFFQDLVGSVFFDSSFTELESRLSYGATLHLETKIFMNVPLDIGVRGQFDREGRFSPDLIFKVMAGY